MHMKPYTPPAATVSGSFAPFSALTFSLDVLAFAMVLSVSAMAFLILATLSELVLSSIFSTLSALLMVSEALTRTCTPRSALSTILRVTSSQHHTKSRAIHFQHNPASRTRNS
ncbi:hypothetical protein TRVL_08930 [Trypanosoma vivax]|nr:hypothetical protein TRVL_08930 [Trypanosoma vivax]